jgi:hypothetical protein
MTPALPLARWIRFTFVGWSIGFALVLLFIAISGSIGLGSTQSPIGLGMGLGVGLGQRRLLRDYLAGITGWLGGTALSLTAPFLVTDVARPLGLDIRYSLAWTVIVGGVLVAVVQWRLLRPHLGKAGWWIPASIIGWAGAGGTVLFNDRMLPRIPGILGALIYVAIILGGGVILGAATGVVLRRLPRLAGAAV